MNENENKIEKMGVIESAEVRASLYELITKTLNENGMETEAVKGGRLVNLNNGFYAKVAFTICDPNKIDKYRQEYVEQMEKNATRAKERAEKAEEKASKAKSKPKAEEEE